MRLWQGWPRYFRQLKIVLTVALLIAGPYFLIAWLCTPAPEPTEGIVIGREERSPRQVYVIKDGMARREWMDKEYRLRIIPPNSDPFDVTVDKNTYDTAVLGMRWKRE